MSDWRKVYRVGDGKKKEQSPVATSSSFQESSKPPKNKKRRKLRFFFTSFLVFTSFSAGLVLGLKEDYEAEEALPATVISMLGEADSFGEENSTASQYQLLSHEEPQVTDYSGNVGGAHVFSNIPRGFTNHFVNQIECRDISMKEVEFVLQFGLIKKFKPTNNKYGSLEPKFNMVAKTQTGRDILVSFVTTERADSLTLITAYPDDGLEDDCK